MRTSNKSFDRKNFIDKLIKDIEKCQEYSIGCHIDHLNNLLFGGHLEGKSLINNGKKYPLLTFLLHLDAISDKLYKSGSSIIDVDKYQEKDGYFNKLFEIASKLIFKLINEEGKKEWNVILKMDAHNHLSGPSAYSLTTHLDDENREIEYKTWRNSNKSKAFELFFLYNEFCKYKCNSKTSMLKESEVYTIHREFSDQKTRRSLAYELNGTKLLRSIDGFKPEEKGNAASTGESYYFDFLRCILNANLENENSDFKNFCDGKLEEELIKKTPLSFAFFNLGISGFESWGTLMIESFKGKSTDIFNMFYNRASTSEDELEDSKLMGMIKNIISALKKVDDEFNDALNKQKIRQESIKSAKAAIMSRNMSHNLGSHVMSYLKQHLGSVREMLNSNVLSQLVEDENYILAMLALKDDKDVKKAEGFINSIVEKRKTEEKRSKKDTLNNPPNEDNNQNDPIDKVAMPFLVGMGQFISYLQERQDFIATIATDYIPYYSTLNFKDFIYDELNNDKRYERHPDRENLKPDNILLGNIARSEGLGRETSPTREKDQMPLGDIVLKFRTTFSGDPVEEIRDNNQIIIVDPLNSKYSYKTKDAVLLACKELAEMRKIDVSLPGGVVGRQAIFSIMENTIRNAAKHGNWREQGKLELTIDICAKEDIDIKVNEIDGTKHYFRKLFLGQEAVELENDALNNNHLSIGEVLEKFYLNSEDADDIYIVTLTDNLTMTESNLAKLRKAIAEDYVNNKGGMFETNKGIKEMRISSAWLRSISDERQNWPLLNGRDTGEELSLDDFAYDRNWMPRKDKPVSPILYSRISNGHLQYIFCLVKPQKVAFVSSDFKNVLGNFIKRQVFNEKGWKIFTPKTYCENKNNNFDFVIYDDSFGMDYDYINVRRRSSSLFINLSQIESLKPIKAIISGINLKDDSEIKMLLDKAYKGLGEKVANWDGNEKILISDARAKANFDNDNTIGKEEKEEVLKMISFEDCPHAKYRYITHLESKQNFQDSYVNDDKSRSLAFSEGITGNNSTDRLLRNESLNKEWFYKHLYVMKQKIAIFDERLFSKAFGLEETDFVIPRIDNYGKDSNDNTEVQRLCELFPNHSKSIERRKDKKEALKKYLNETIGYDPHVGLDKEEVDCKCHLGATYAAKGLFIFSIIRSCKNPNSFNLYGYIFDQNNDMAFSKCKKYASFNWDFEKKELNIEPKDDCRDSILKSYNYISIHQGLLDKLYEVFGLKSDSQAKENVTRKIFSYFTQNTNNSEKVGTDKKEEVLIKNDILDYKIETTDLKLKNINHYFLPGMTIHSGRSKPSEADMPQLLPFIPYSAIEHAVMDCKYSLVKLLNTARYE